MKVQPPAESFHQDLSRPSLGVCENVCVFVYVRMCVYVSLTMSVVCAFTLGGRENPTIISVS